MEGLNRLPFSFKLTATSASLAAWITARFYGMYMQGSIERGGVLPLWHVSLCGVRELGSWMAYLPVFGVWIRGHKVFGLHCEGSRWFAILRPSRFSSDSTKARLLHNIAKGCHSDAAYRRDRRAHSILMALRSSKGYPKVNFISFNIWSTSKRLQRGCKQVKKLVECNVR